jgi:hypothetical protein
MMEAAKGGSHKLVIRHSSLVIQMRRGAESNRRISVLQTDALPLCYRAIQKIEADKRG